jgi:hypothetical protein
MEVRCDTVFKRDSAMNTFEAQHRIRTAGVTDTGQSHECYKTTSGMDTIQHCCFLVWLVF